MASDKRLTPDGIDALIGSERFRKILDVSPRRFWTLRAAGTLPPADVTLGKSLRWRTSTISEWLDSQTQKTPGVGGRRLRGVERGGRDE